MSFIQWVNSKIKKMNWVDMALLKLSCMVFGIMLVVLIPSLIDISIWWLLIAFIALALKPMYAVFSK